MKNRNPGKRLSKKETERLRVILDPEQSGKNTMPLEAVDGLFACLVCSPQLAPPSEWMPLVWGDEGPGFKSESEAQRTLGLLMRMWNEVAGAIHSNNYGPMVTTLESTKGEELTFAKDWARGFIEGMMLHKDYWLDPDQNELTELLELIVDLAEDGDDDVGRQRKEVQEVLRWAGCPGWAGCVRRGHASLICVNHIFRRRRYFVSHSLTFG